jgi:catechol 2,3-dioxygenase-like lactoylglutathione lyase family enzyme
MSRWQIARIRMRCRDLAVAAAFYRDAFGCEVDAAAPGVQRLVLRLGRESVELVAGADRSGLAPANSTAFQHFAIVVSDIDAAMARLRACTGWTSISAGPQKLPAASGGVTAFKFRDPEGHPLEFLQFPAAASPNSTTAARTPVLGIDHTAITVADTARSVSFYAGLGFAVTSTHINTGLSQDRLDGLEDARVEVTTLVQPGAPPPHLELLRYSNTIAESLDAKDARATTLVCHPVENGAPDAAGVGGHGSVAGAEQRLSDPDGHRLELHGYR